MSGSTPWWKANTESTPPARPAPSAPASKPATQVPPAQRGMTPIPEAPPAPPPRAEAPPPPPSAPARPEPVRSEPVHSEPLRPEPQHAEHSPRAEAPLSARLRDEETPSDADASASLGDQINLAIGDYDTRLAKLRETLQERKSEVRELEVEIADLEKE